MSKKVAFLGIGLMGLPMARNLLKAGFDLCVWNRSVDKARVLASEGAAVANHLEEALTDADLVISMLADGQVVFEVVQAAIGSGALKSDATWVDMSSTSVDDVRAISSALADAGIAFMDAPVSGGVKGAEAATLAIMAGATPAVFESASPMLKHLGNPVRVGEVGAGQVAKLANQSMVAAYIGATSEAVLLCEAYGVDATAFRAALKGGFADSAVLQLHGQRMADRAFTPGAKATTQLKDMRNIRAAAQSQGLSMPMAESLTDRFTQLCSDPERSTLDHSALFLELLDRNTKS